MNKNAYTDLYCDSCGSKHPEPVKGQIVESEPRAIFVPIGNLPESWHRYHYDRLPESWYAQCEPGDPNSCFDFVHWCAKCNDKYENHPLEVIKKP